MAHRVPRVVGPAPAAARAIVAALLFAHALVAGSCSSPTGPSRTRSSAGAAGGSSLSGRIVGALDDAGVAGLTVQVASGASGVSDSSGQFMLVGVPEGLQMTTVSGASCVTRQTGTTAPAAGVTIQAIPSSFDLASLDQMLRASGRLQRWTVAPRLVVISRVLQFTTTGDDEFMALGEELSEAETDGLVADLVDGFSELTGGRLGAFAGTAIERPAESAPVLVKRQGSIVVARHRGLSAATGYWGYGRWATTGEGEVVGGIVFLDRDFERSLSAYRRSLRIHELGHALGYMHVTLRVSAMNSSARELPNEWDRQVVRIAFQRPPGNRTPDTDPASYSVNASSVGTAGGAITWGPWIH